MSEGKSHPSDETRERKLFLAALDLRNDGERRTFLDNACSDDAALRDRLGRMLKFHSGDSNFLAEDEAFAGDILRGVASSNRATESGSSPPAHTPIATGRQSRPSWEPPAPESLDPLFENYEIESLVGCGGMGAVYRGIQTSLERPVAIKILRPEISDDRAFAERFRREALAMAKLSHPNLVAIHDYGSTMAKLESPDGELHDGRIYFLVMEFIDGTDLYQLIRTGDLDHETALSMIRQICDALEYAHSAGYVHRDIKPANIFITPSGAVKVGDFGLAKLTDSGESAPESANLTMTGFVMGTPNYLAPENLNAEEGIDHRADIYSLGVMFYEMLTGTVPKGAFPPPSEKVAIDVRLDGVVLKAMQSERELRYQQASEIKRDIDEISSSVSKKRDGNDSKSAAGNRGRLIWRVAGVSLILVIGAGIWFFIKQNDEFAGPGKEPSAPEPTVDGVTTPEPATASKEIPFENSLGMRFVPVPVNGGPTNGKTILFSIWETRVADIVPFLKETKRPPKQTAVQPKDNDPATELNWEEAVAYCEWLTEREREAGRIGPETTYRLPTDHEWSCAVGIGDREDPNAEPWDKARLIRGVYPWGTDWPPPKGAGNFAGEETAGMDFKMKGPLKGYDDNTIRFTAVGSFRANSLGLFDLGGNVSEWCQDEPDSTEENTRILRGGSWKESEDIHLISSNRFLAEQIAHWNSYGLRCVLEVGDDKKTADPAHSASTEVDASQVLELWKLTDPELDRLEGDACRIVGDTLVFDFEGADAEGTYKGADAVALPVHPAGSYCFSVSFRKKAAGKVGMILPVGDRRVTLRFYNDGQVNLEESVPSRGPGTMRLARANWNVDQPGNALTWETTVKLMDEGEVEISLRTGGSEVLAWKGNRIDLDGSAGPKPPLVLTHRDNWAYFKAPTLQMFDGKVYHLR